MTRKTKKIILETIPTLQDFAKAEQLFAKTDPSINKIKRSETFAFSAIRSNGEIFLLSQGYFFGNDDENMNLRALLHKKGITHVKIAFKKLPNGNIKPMVAKIITQTSAANKEFRSSLQQEMFSNNLFGMTPYSLVMERESYSKKFSEVTIKSYLILEDCGYDLIDSFSNYKLSHLAILDIAAQCFDIPGDFAGKRHVHRDLKLDNISVQPINNSAEYEEIFFKVIPIDLGNVVRFSNDKTQQYLSNLTNGDYAGTWNYAPPFLVKSFSNQLWNLIVIPHGSPVKLTKEYGSSFILQENEDNSLTLFLLHFYKGKFHRKNIQISNEKMMDFSKKHNLLEKESNNLDKKGPILFKLNREQLRELLEPTEGFLCNATRRECLFYPYKLETDLYSIARTVSALLNELQKSSASLLCNETRELLKILKDCVTLIETSYAFHPCNPNPTFEEWEHKEINDLIDSSKKLVKKLKDLRLKPVPELEENFAKSSSP